MHAFAAAGAGFLLAVLWFDLMFDVQTRKHPRDAVLPPEVLASISAYYRRVTTEAYPMNRLVASVALIQALGATPTKVFTVTTLEAVIASATGALLGAVVSVPIIAAVGRAAIVDVGSVNPLIFPMSEAIRYAILAILAAVLAAVVPAWKTTQAALAPQLRDE